jgi:diguanylate cyclase (GGDEF)-like protein/PAS domain S-box-containing protein
MSTGSDAAPAPEHAHWATEAFERLADLVVVVDPTGSIVWANPFAGELLGFGLDEATGTNLADYLHPDDLVRALRVMSLMVDREIDVAVTPAVYRLRRSDGTWCPIELNASMLPGPAGDDPGAGLLLIFGRYSGDRDLSDRIMEQLTSGREPGDVIDLIPEFGLWRHPFDHYAVRYTGESGEHRVAGTPVACDLAEIDVAGSPWDLAASSGEEVTATLADLPEELRQAAIARGLVECWVVPVPDPLHGFPATIMAWSRLGSAMEVHRYAVETMARLLTLILQWRQQVTSLRNAARRDPLTGLINRSGFLEQLEAAGAGGDPPRIGVLYIDLDGFKGVNDVHGHRAGDSVLAHVGQRLTGVLRPGDVVGRLGGDEFAVLCPHLTTDDDAVAIAERVVDALERPFVAEGLEVQIGASVGIATTAPGELEAEQLIDIADQALYRAKAEGRGRWHLLSSSPATEPEG